MLGRSSLLTGEKKVFTTDAGLPESFFAGLSINRMRWIDALKKFNEGKIWCVPRKGTADYEAVKRIQRGEVSEPPKPALAPQKQESKDEYKKRIKEELAELKTDLINIKNQDIPKKYEVRKLTLAGFLRLQNTVRNKIDELENKLKQMEEEQQPAPKPAPEPPKPAPKPAPKPEPKPAPEPPKPEPKPQPKDVTKRRKLLNLISDLLSSGSKRNFAKVKQEFEKDFPEFANNKTLNTIFSGKDADFYPTPAECLQKFPEIVRAIENAENVLEPTAGLGSMVDVIEEINPDAKITANELNVDFIPILKKLFPGVNVTQENFMEYENKNNFDLIVCNPPFSFGGNKKVYLDFLYKCLYMLNQSTARGELQLIFICPNFIGSKMEDFFNDMMFFGNKNVIPTLSEYLKDEIPVATGKKILKEIGNDDVSEKNEDLAEKIIEKYGFYEGRYLGDCKGFGGTNVVASIYQFIVINRSSGGRKSRKALANKPKRAPSTWIVALKQWNSGKPKWCVPGKRTPEYFEIMEIKKKLDEDKVAPVQKESAQVQPAVMRKPGKKEGLKLTKEERQLPPLIQVKLDKLKRVKRFYSENPNSWNETIPAMKKVFFGLIRDTKSTVPAYAKAEYEEWAKSN
jgi:phospholipid N-methyltransferase